MGRKRTICCDIDETISHTHKRDYANATPITPMINKLNKLYDEGWEITYFTARGQLSSGGDLETINKTRKPVLIKWLAQNGVKYNDLLMGKPFADYYIDDKALTPDMFLATDFGLKLEDGRSGAEVSRVGDLVIKVAENAQMQVDWFKEARGFVIVPFIVDSAPSVYRMEYINGRPGWDRLEAKTISDMTLAVHQFRKMDPMKDYRGSFRGYVARCIRNIPVDIAREVETLCLAKEDYFDSEQSFCHGDLTLTNVIVNNKTHLIDPSVQKGIWSSWLIDIGRMMQSLNGRYEEKFLGAPIDNTKIIYIPFILSEFKISLKNLPSNGGVDTLPYLSSPTSAFGERW